MAKSDEKKVILTSKEQEIRSMVERATDGPPKIENVTELYRRVEMQIPEEIRRPECVYRWLAADNLQKETVGNRRRWEIVTRSNHSHAPTAWFGDSGAIQYGSDAVLCFQWRDQAEAMQAQIEKDFNINADKLLNPNPVKYHGPGGKERAIIEPVSGELGRATMEKALVNSGVKSAGEKEGYYDFGDTGS